jgi:membrane protein implicated in regulation of membrane protease activity
LILVANKNKPKLKPGDPSLNNKTFRMIGRVVTLNSDEHGGVVDIDDTLWRLVDDQKNMFSKGDLVKVQALENGKLRLAKIEKNDQA